VRDLSDNNGVSEDARDSGRVETATASAGRGGRRLAVVSYEPRRSVRVAGEALPLVREFKGPTIASLWHDRATVLRLPGRVCSAHGAIDCAPAERRGETSCTVLPGPGSNRRRAARWPWCVLLVLWLLAAVATSAALAWR